MVTSIRTIVTNPPPAARYVSDGTIQRLKEAEEPKQEHDENNDDNESDDAIGSTHGFSPVLVQGSLQG